MQSQLNNDNALKIKNIRRRTILLISCGRPAKKYIHDVYRPLYTTQQLVQKLEVAGSAKPAAALGLFFKEWNELVKPNTIEFIKNNDTTKALYDIYKAFYQPMNLSILGKWEQGNLLQQTGKYVVVQNQLSYKILPFNGFDSSLNNDTLRLLPNFRPPVNLPVHKVLYFTKEYDSALHVFLEKTPKSPLGANGVHQLISEGENNSRYLKIRDYISVNHGYWGGYFHLETVPFISIILLNKDLTKAKVDFIVGSRGGSAILAKSGRYWAIKESKATWIE